MTGPLPYIGGKSRLSKTIISLLPDHLTYIEPFMGSAQVFFRKPPSAVEVLNDKDFEVVNFFRVVQWHYQELLRYLRYSLVSRKLHELHLRTDPATLTDVQRAARYFFLMKNSFAGLVVRHSYHYMTTQPSNYNLARLPDIITRAHQRLQRVQIECLDYREILGKFDRPTSVFYIDSPYWARKMYNYNFTEQDFAELARRLRQLKGKFLLSIDDRAETRQLFANFVIRPVTLSYSAQRTPGKRYRELIVTNYQPAVSDAAAEVPDTEPRAEPP